ncbi:MAG: hypothetical protein RJA78_877 [Actinomycetota bacterium]
MDKVSQNLSSCTNCQSEIEPRNILGQFVVGGFILDSLISSLESKNQGDSTVCSWVIAGRNDDAFSEACSSEIRITHGSSSKSARCSCGPSSEVSFISLNSEGVTSFELFNQEPADAYSSQRIEDLDSSVGQNNLWVDNKNPKKYVDGNAIERAGDCFIGSPDRSERCYHPDFNSNNQSKVNPITCWSESVVFGHNSKTTPLFLDQSGDTASKKGSN